MDFPIEVLKALKIEFCFLKTSNNSWRNRNFRDKMTYSLLKTLIKVTSMQIHMRRPYPIFFSRSNQHRRLIYLYKCTYLWVCLCTAIATARTEKVFLRLQRTRFTRLCVETTEEQSGQPVDRVCVIFVKQIKAVLAPPNTIRAIRPIGN